MCGSADVLEQLGVKIDLQPEGVARGIEGAGIGFLFAPIFHPSFRFAGVPRRELGVRTVFNVLGPLCNPAGARYQALGVADGGLAGKMADVLLRLGVERALVFHSEDGMDELSLSAPSHVIEIDGARREYQLDVSELGLKKAALVDVRGGGPEENARIAREVLAGALRGAGLAVIAEVKQRTPSMGVLTTDYRPARLAESYEGGGAAAISVLTHRAGFGGSVDHLDAVREATSLPILRKDFITDAYQVVEARAHGADAVLLIVAALTPHSLVALLNLAKDHGLAALVEVHDEDETRVAVDAGAQVIGVNHP